MNPRGRRRLRRILTYAVIAVAILVVVLLALVEGGVLVLSSNSPAPVTISSVHLVISEGSTAGTPWFGPSSINYTAAEGYPIQVSPGGSWTVVWTFFSLDTKPHNVTGVFPFSPFTLKSTMPGLPYAVAPGDDGALAMSITAPSSAGGTYAVTVNIDVGSVS
ncbi:MAG: hypothetical protein ACLP8Y_02290 [Thermoplasmata archaeon]